MNIEEKVHKFPMVLGRFRRGSVRGSVRGSTRFHAYVSVKNTSLWRGSVVPSFPFQNSKEGNEDIQGGGLCAASRPPLEFYNAPVFGLSLAS